MDVELQKQRIFSCPYCHGELNEGAISCRFCSRDLTPILPLIMRLSSLETRIGEFEKLMATKGAGQLLLSGPQPQLVIEPFKPGPRGWAVLPLGFLGLIAAYATVVFWLDLPLFVLRLSSIAIPFGTGFVYFGARYRMRWLDNLVAILFSSAAVLSMNAILAAIDSIPLLPQGTAAWRESMYYVISIAASMISGMLLRVTVMALGARGLTSLPRLRQGLLTVNKSIPSDTLKAIEMAVLLIGTLMTGIAGLFTGLVGLSG